MIYLHVHGLEFIESTNSKRTTEIVCGIWMKVWREWGWGAWGGEVSVSVKMLLFFLSLFYILAFIFSLFLFNIFSKIL